MLSSLSRKPWYLLVLPAAALLAVLGYRSGLAQSGAGAEQAVAGQVEAALVANAASPRPTRPPPVLRERSTS
ncbi:hypothetical protein, partial [Stenotrophomonas pictorum]|uniref:hypothetical protein n=1 Tax=Stenotrophomonas pictorum TaxID=86184 RepID=UPI000ADC4AF2